MRPHVRVDLGGPARERRSLLRADAVELGDAVVGRAPLDAQLKRERAPEGRLVDVAGRLGLLVDRAAVQRRP
jgi:hypothetical protein